MKREEIFQKGRTERGEGTEKMRKEAKNGNKAL